MYKSIDLPNGEGPVVLFEQEMAPGCQENLVCFGPDESARWRAKLPSDPRYCFVAVWLDCDVVLANSMSCYAVWIDPATGRTLRTQFTK